MIIAIPSRNRVGGVTTLKVFPDGVLFVPETEYKDYKNNYKNVISVPKEIKGITQTRNYILKNTNDKQILFIDDDVNQHGYYAKNDKGKRQIKRLTTDEWLYEINKWFGVCSDLKYKIWGVKTEANLMTYYAYAPLRTLCYVTASFMGVINDGEYYFDENYKVKEDYEICLRHIKDKGGILNVQYLVWQNSHWKDKGGCSEYRTIEMERQAIQMLLKDYGSYIKTISRKASEYTIRLRF